MSERATILAATLVAGLALMIISVQAAGERGWDILTGIGFIVGLAVVLGSVWAIYKLPRAKLEFGEPHLETIRPNRYVAAIDQPPGTSPSSIGSNYPMRIAVEDQIAKTFAYLPVSNRRGDTDADGARAVLTFYSAEGVRCFDPIDGRWAESDEVRDVPRRDRIDDVLSILAGRERTLDLVHKENADADAYAMNTEATYKAPSDWKYEKWRLPPGTYQIEVVVRSKGNRPLRGWVEYVNGGASMEPAVRMGHDPRTP